MKSVIIGIQGGKGSTNEQAAYFFAKKYKWTNIEIQYLVSTENVLKALEDGQIEFGTFAWKSSLGGFVEETQKATQNHSFKKVDELTIPIDHTLLSKNTIDASKKIHIFSHPQALKVHSSFLKKEFSIVNIQEEVDTALAAEKLSTGKYPENSLVIAPKDCAEIYNLEVFQKELPSNKGYKTTIYLAEKPTRSPS